MNKECHGCHVEKPLSEFTRILSRSRYSGLASVGPKCRVCVYEERRAPGSKTKLWRSENKEHIAADSRKRANAPKGKYSEYRRQAVRRSLVFAITFDEFMLFWKKPCRYCDGPIETIGLDRKNNSVGYVIDNITACCSRCNYAKTDMNSIEFVSFCSAVHRNVEKNPLVIADPVGR